MARCPPRWLKSIRSPRIMLGNDECRRRAAPITHAVHRSRAGVYFSAAVGASAREKSLPKIESRHATRAAVVTAVRTNRRADTRLRLATFSSL